jgi:hypothetical protein
MELPSFLMGIAQIHKPFRNDILFGISFFITRIVIHIAYIFYIALISFRGTWIFIIPLLPLPLHIYWFYEWCVQQLRKRHSDTEEDLSSSTTVNIRKESKATVEMSTPFPSITNENSFESLSAVELEGAQHTVVNMPPQVVVRS